MNNFLRSKEPILCIRKSRIVAGKAKLLVRAIKKSVIGQVGDSIDKKCHLLKTAVLKADTGRTKREVMD